MEEIHPMIKLNPSNANRSSSEFVKQIETMVQREESIPELINSSSKKEMSDSNFQDDLLQIIYLNGI